MNDDDKSVREWFVEQAKSYGCSVKVRMLDVLISHPLIDSKRFDSSQVDQVGNMFATRPGMNNILPPIAMGSHLGDQIATMDPSHTN